MNYMSYDNMAELLPFLAAKIEGGSGASIKDWVASTTYAVGNLVIYQNSLYKCITANNDSTFDETKWQEIGGGSGGANVIKDILFDTSTQILDNTIINLSKPYTDYDYLLIEKIGSGYDLIWVQKDEINRSLTLSSTGNYHVTFSFDPQSTTQFKIYNVTDSSSSSILYRITGIKFINPNVYSTTEQRIGTWIDGKPLYQVTRDSVTDSAGLGAVDFSALNIDQCIYIDGYIYNSNNGFHPINYRTIDGSLAVAGNVGGDRVVYLITSGSIFQNRPFAITIKYTKTTD